MDEEMTDDHGRPMPPLESGEVATLQGFLDYQRAMLEWKCRGLTGEQLRVALPPSSVTLGGLLKHLAYTEDCWFTEVVGQAAALSHAHSAWEGQGRASLRWVLGHMIEEYARHNGHADLIREPIDGETGE